MLTSSLPDPTPTKRASDEHVEKEGVNATIPAHIHKPGQLIF